MIRRITRAPTGEIRKSEVLTDEQVSPALSDLAHTVAIDRFVIHRADGSTVEYARGPELAEGEELILTPEELLAEHGVPGYQPLTMAAPERLASAVEILGKIRKTLYDEPAQEVLERIKAHEGDSSPGLAHAYAETFGIVDARLIHAKILMDSLWVQMVSLEVGLHPEEDRWARR